MKKEIPNYEEMIKDLGKFKMHDLIMIFSILGICIAVLIAGMFLIGVWF